MYCATNYPATGDLTAPTNKWDTATNTNYPERHVRVVINTGFEKSLEEKPAKRYYVPWPVRTKPWHLNVRAMPCPVIVSRPEFHARSNPRTYARRRYDDQGRVRRSS